MKRLKEVYNQIVERSKTVAQDFPWENKYAYTHHLAHSHYNTKHSPSLITLAASRFEIGKDEKLKRRCIKHAAEEYGHENLAIKDLESLGCSINDLPERKETKALYSTQYYLIEHVDPICLYGAILGTEGWSSVNGPYIRSRLEKAWPKSMRFRKVHADNDPQHVDDAFSSLEGISEVRLNLVVENLQTYMDFFLEIHIQIANEARQLAKNAA